MIPCSRSVAETATSARQKNTATAVSALRPKCHTHDATSSAETSSIAG
jgi:hypothetical protein